MRVVFVKFFGLFLTPALGPESNRLNHTSVFVPGFLLAHSEPLEAPSTKGRHALGSDWIFS